MRSFSTAVDIEATPAEVWAVLADLAAYPDWNPFIREAEGVLAADQTLILCTRSLHGRETTLRPKVLVAHPDYEIRWISRLLVPGVLDREHVFDLTDGGDGTTRVVQALTFRGLLVPFVAHGIDTVVDDFDALNEALRKRVETT
jgi:hypothetical protein